MLTDKTKIRTEKGDVLYGRLYVLGSIVTQSAYPSLPISHSACLLDR